MAIVSRCDVLFAQQLSKKCARQDFFCGARQSAGNLPEPSNKQAPLIKQTPLMVQVQGARGALIPCC
jgi:hypothetical protein